MTSYLQVYFRHNYLSLHKARQTGTRAAIPGFIPRVGQSKEVVMATVGPDVMVRETARLIASDKVEGTPVRRSNGDRSGTIERGMIDKRSGRVADAVMKFSGVCGIVEEYRSRPASVLTYNDDHARHD